jgi:uncharacterized protein (TIGR02147 family)
LPEIYTYKDYKAFIRDQITENRQTRGYRQLLADAAGCQRTYLSQVLNSHIELTPDHAVGMTIFWGLGASASDYFLELVSISRAGTPALKKLIQSRLDRLKRAHLDLGERIRAPTLTAGSYEAIYYSSWLFSALHIVIRLESCRTSAAVAAYLEIPEELARGYLKEMAAIGLVTEEQGQWRALASNLHLPRSSPYLWRHHQNWREFALRAAQTHDDEAIHFTSVHSLSVRDSERIADLLRELIVKSRQIIEPSKDEIVTSLCIDYFAVGKLVGFR